MTRPSAAAEHRAATQRWKQINRVRGTNCRCGLPGRIEVCYHDVVGDEPFRVWGCTQYHAFANAWRCRFDGTWEPDPDVTFTFMPPNGPRVA